jgi:diguanylate cyclase (GGDEF)-like protein
MRNKANQKGMIGRMLSRTAAALHVISRNNQGADYKALSRYIININRLASTNDVLSEVSVCLRELLDYEVFGFAVKDESGFDIWVDPRTYREQVLKIVERDFGGPMTGYSLHHLSEEHEEAAGDVAALDGMLSYRVSGTIEARLYVQPRKKMLPRHHDIMDTVVRSLGVAIENLRRLHRLEAEASTDPLTGCYNRRTFERFISHELSNVRRHGGAITMIMFDLDHFKRVNDTYGHQAGDQVLTEISALVMKTVRSGDYVVRYGGEEFMIVLPKCGLYRGMVLAERLRREIEAMDITLPDGRVINLTSSFGVATLREDQALEPLVHEADMMLYQAKKTRNTVVPSLNVHSAIRLQPAMSC